jgi:hypothetical protein
MNTRRPESGSQGRSNRADPPWVIYVHQNMNQDHADSLIDEASRAGQPIIVKIQKPSTQTEAAHHVLGRALDKDVTVTFEIVSGPDER